jgi:quercetin dioxygenase-like cupin family protein
MSRGYEVVTLAELERHPNPNDPTALLMPLRYRLGLRAFGANCWTADVGERIVPLHSEESGDEELYVVVSGRATFTVDGRTVDAPAGMLVHVDAGEVREAVAEEEGTIVLAVGATPGEAFEARGWDEVTVAFGRARAGQVDAGRSVLEQVADKHRNDWQADYNRACFEAQFGDRAVAFERLRDALAKAPDEVRRYAQADDDLAPLRDDARWQEVVS